MPTYLEGMNAQNEIKAQANALEIVVYDDIDSGFAAQIVERTRAVPDANTITLRINSPGGAVTEALAAYNALRNHSATIEVHIDGLAASSASLLAMAGDWIVMAENALFMIHDPWTSATGNATELRRLADTLDKHRDAMLKAYARRWKGKTSELQALLTAETWLDADEALKAGFVDEIAAPLAIAASLDLSRFDNPPKRTRSTVMPETQTHTPGEEPNTPKKPEVVATTEAEVRARIQARNDEIRTIFQPFLIRGQYQDLYNDVMANTNLSVDQVREKLLAKMGEGCEPLASDPPSISMGYDRRESEFKAAVTDGLLMRFGVPVKNPHPAARDVRGMGAVEIAGTLLSQRGRSTRGQSKAEIIQAALTTSDMPELLSNVANKALITGMQESEAATHRIWTRSGELPDFKEAKRVALSEAPGLSKVNEGAEYTFGALTDAAEPIRLETFGRILGITRQALVNDDLGELSRVPFALGQAAARREADAVYSLLINNPAMRDTNALFSVAHANEGTAAALSVDSLGEARKLMRLQKGLQGEGALNITPRYLLVPAALETKAEQLLASIQPSATSNAVPEWVRRLVVVVDARLDDDSTTAWYLAADPVMYDTIEVARLDGQGATIEQRDAFVRDVLEIKCRLDVGAAVLDWRGLVRNEGA